MLLKHHMTIIIKPWMFFMAASGVACHDLMTIQIICTRYYLFRSVFQRRVRVLPVLQVIKYTINIWYQRKALLCSVPHFCFCYFFPWMCSTTAFQWNNLQQCAVKDHSSHLCNPPPKQLHADWGQMKWAASFDFNWKTKLRQRQLRFPVLSVLPSETEKDLRFQRRTQPQLQRLLTLVGVQNLAAPSIVAE